jgi:hypothetical protein
MFERAFVWCLALCALAAGRAGRLLELAAWKPKRSIRITPVSSAYIDKVIRGV